jgi:hypothetical protein
MRINMILWGNNTSYATRRATIDEIEDVLMSASSSFRRNLPGRAGTHQASGRTRQNRPLTVIFIYRSADRAAIPINAWGNQ